MGLKKIYEPEIILLSVANKLSHEERMILMENFRCKNIRVIFSNESYKEINFVEIF